MNIDRTKALFLVGALAGTSACVVTSSDDDGTGGGGSSGSQSGGSAGVAGGGSGGAAAGAGGSSTGGTAGSATGGVGAASGAGGATGGSGGATGGAGGAAAGAGGAGGATGGAGGTGGATGGTGGASCDDSVGAVVDCSAAQCSSTDTFAEGVCNAVKGRAKRAVAEKIGNCILALGLSQRCNFNSDVYTCVEGGLLQSCPDATAATSCGTITSTCTSVDSATCETYLSGVEDSYRGDFVSCMETYCDFYTCSESMSF